MQNKDNNYKDHKQVAACKVFHRVLLSLNGTACLTTSNYLHFWIMSSRINNYELFDKVCSALLKVLARKASSSAEWTEASEESNQEQILRAWSQVLRWSKSLYSASWKPTHSGEVLPDRGERRKIDSHET